MNLCVDLLAIFVTAMATADASGVCRGDGVSLKPFSGPRMSTKLPCKYPALRNQICGNYKIDLTPANIFVSQRHYVDSLWINVKDINSGGKWIGRCDNKMAVKYMNGWKQKVVHRKGGDLHTRQVFEFGKTAKTAWMKTINGDFKISFAPFDPDNGDFSQSEWIFRCMAHSFTPVDYPQQLCGGAHNAPSEDIMNQAVYYEIFTNTKLGHKNAVCSEVATFMANNCLETRRRDAIHTCHEILSSPLHTQCVSKYSCGPMGPFLDCITWVCSDYTNDTACGSVARSIDMCRPFDAGNLTGKVHAANCFKDFISIESIVV